MSASKPCRICGTEKPLDEFYRSSGMRDGNRHDCKDCNKAEKRRRYAADPDKYIAMVKRWQQANPERVNENHRRNNARPERKRALRDGYYRRTFGISADEFDGLLSAQGGGVRDLRGHPEAGGEPAPRPLPCHRPSPGDLVPVVQPGAGALS